MRSLLAEMGETVRDWYLSFFGEVGKDNSSPPASPAFHGLYQSAAAGLLSAALALGSGGCTARKVAVCDFVGNFVYIGPRDKCEEKDEYKSVILYVPSIAKGGEDVVKEGGMESPESQLLQSMKKWGQNERDYACSAGRNHSVEYSCGDRKISFPGSTEKLKDVRRNVTVFNCNGKVIFSGHVSTCSIDRAVDGDGNPGSTTRYKVNGGTLTSYGRTFTIPPDSWIVYSIVSEQNSQKPTKHRITLYSKGKRIYDGPFDSDNIDLECRQEEGQERWYIVSDLSYRGCLLKPFRDKKRKYPYGVYVLSFWQDDEKESK